MRLRTNIGLRVFGRCLPYTVAKVGSNFGELRRAAIDGIRPSTSDAVAGRTESGRCQEATCQRGSARAAS